MTRFRSFSIVPSLLLIALCAPACGGDDDGGPSGTEADMHGVGAACVSNADCWEKGQSCLAFKGGYCGVQGCMDDSGCPSGSRCVAHTDSVNYCFLVCTDKADCNLNRPVESESNCSSSITFVEGSKGKACVPPS